MMPLLYFLLFVAWSVWVLSMGMRRARRMIERELAELGHPMFAKPPEPAWSIPVSMADYETWMLTDRKEVSLTQ